MNGRAAGGTELTWCRAVPGGTGITVLSLLLSRSIPLPLLRSSLRRLQLSHPLLRARLPSVTAASSGGPPPLILISPSPSDDIEIIPSDHLPLPLAAAGDTAVSLFHSLIEHELNRNPWAEDEPVRAFFATVYELPKPGWSALVIRVHTGICDRTAGVAILKDLVEILSRGEEAADADEEREREVVLAIENLIRKEDAWKPFWARGKDLIGYSLNGLRSTSLRFEDADSNRRSEVVKFVMGAEATRKLLAVSSSRCLIYPFVFLGYTKKLPCPSLFYVMTKTLVHLACDTKGFKLCTALTAAGILATYASKNLQNNQSETYSVVTLIDCRKFLEPPLDSNHIGFYNSAIINAHTVSGREGFWEVATRCHNAYSYAKNNKKHLTDMGELNFLMCKAIENPHLTEASSLRTALISIFEEQVHYDTPVEQSRGLGIEDLLGCSSVHGVGSSIAFFQTIRNGQLDCACVYPSPLHSRNQIQELLDDMKRILVESSCVVDEGS